MKISVKPKVYWTCWICNWRCASRARFKEHMKDQHYIKQSQIKMLKPV